MATKRKILIAFLLLALLGAGVAAQVQGCEMMDGGRHTPMACPTAILPAPLALGLVALALVAIMDPPFSGQIILVPADHPPRPSRAR